MGDLRKQQKIGSPNDGGEESAKNCAKRRKHSREEEANSIKVEDAGGAAATQTLPQEGEAETLPQEGEAESVRQRSCVEQSSILHDLNLPHVSLFSLFIVSALDPRMFAHDPPTLHLPLNTFNALLFFAVPHPSNQPILPHPIHNPSSFFAHLLTVLVAVVTKIGAKLLQRKMRQRPLRQLHKRKEGKASLFSQMSRNS